ncbi:glycosyltransferase [Roseobacter sp. HKCC-CH-9208]|uniref:glycosyltransferase n=1 Tax=Roseobacter sp. HKCC-CH-9208 TaxID=3120339 RepID=UPI0030EB5061
MKFSHPKNGIYWFGGAPSHYFASAHKRLQDLYSDFWFIYQVKGRADIDALGCNVTGCNNVCVSGFFQAIIAVFNIFLKSKPKVVIVSGVFPPLCMFAIIFSIIFGIKFIYLSDETIYGNYRRSRLLFFLSKLFKTIALHFSHIIIYIGTLNYCNYFMYNERFKAKLVHCPLPFNLNPYEVTSGDNCGDKPRLADCVTFLYVGRLSPEKGVECLFDAAEILLSSGKAKFKIVIVGSGPDVEFLENYCKQLNIEEHVSFVGYLEPPEVAKEYRNADVFVMPSHRDAWCLAIAEAMTFGLPVVAPLWVGSTADLVVHGFNGFLVPNNSGHHLARQMAKFMECPDVLADFSYNSYQIMKARSAHGVSFEEELSHLIDCVLMTARTNL